MARIRLQRLSTILVILFLFCIFLNLNSRTNRSELSVLMEKWEKMGKSRFVTEVDQLSGKHKLKYNKSISTISKYLVKYSSENHDFLEEMIDWEDHKFSEREALQVGPGEQGTGVSLNVSEKEKVVKLMNVNGFNAVASDKISLHRSIKDLRTYRCNNLKYSRNLPQSTIIIPFHDEHMSTLLRTVHTLISRAPKILIQEVILVDDNSTKPFLGTELDEYVKKTFNNVRIIRTKKREGLIRARILGAKAATAPILIFIDSHCEAGINWLPPLVQPIYEDEKTVTCPFIDVINENDFSIGPQDEGARGAFDWNFDYKRLPRLREDAIKPEKPFDSPIMAGGLFAINRKWFWKLGGYDSGLEVWGGEQYELSFKIWMCGGRMIDIPCSRIAHVYRKFSPFGVPGLGDYSSRNYKRIAEVWMDDWKTYIYNKHPGTYNAIDEGDLTKQKSLRSKLKCHSFDWFMKAIAFDLLQHYPILEPQSMSKGKFISEEDSSKCLDSKFGKQGDQVYLAKCISESNADSNGEQNLELTWRFEIKPKGQSVCFDYPNSGRVLVLFECHFSEGNQYWKYDIETHQLVHVQSGKCIDSKPQRLEIFMDVCKPSKTQKWILEGLNEDAVRKKWNNFK